MSIVISNAIIIKLIILYIIYWVVLLFKYDIEKKYKISQIDEDKLFKKYNPMVAGCLQGDREILSRDIIAIIINLIDKKNINFEFEHSINNNEQYIYYISKVKEKEVKLDEIEKIIYYWLFLRCKR